MCTIYTVIIAYSICAVKCYGISETSNPPVDILDYLYEKNPYDIEYYTMLLKNKVAINKKILFPILCFILVTFVCLLNFRWGFFILGNDNYSPELNPLITLQKLMQSPGWREYRALGIMSDTEQTDLPRVILFTALSATGIPNWFISQIYIYTGLFFALFGAGLLVSKFLKNTNNEFTKYMGAILYVSSMVGIWVFFSPTHQFFNEFCFLPIFLLAVINTVELLNLKNILYLVWSIILIMPSGLTATVIIVVIGLVVYISFMWFITDEKHRRIRLKNGILVIFIVTLMNLYWIAPFALYVASNTADLKNSLIYRKITPDVISAEAKNNNVWNTLLQKYYWIEAETNGKYNYKFADFYNDSPIFKLIGVFLLLHLTYGIISGLRRKDLKIILLLPIYVVGLYLIKGQNPPFQWFFIFLQNRFPIFFGQVFRWASSKFWPLTLIPYIVFITLGFSQLLHAIKRPLVRRLYVLSLVSAIVVMYLPALRGYLIGEKSFAKFPTEYYKLEDKLSKDYPNSRIFLLPESNTLYFKSHEWGFWGSTFLGYILNNPIFDKALVIGSSSSEAAFYDIRNAYYSRSNTDFINALRYYNVDLVLVDKSVNQYTGYEIDEDTLAFQTSGNQLLTQVYSDGKGISLFKVSDTSDSLNTTTKELDKNTKSSALYSGKNGLNILQLTPSSISVENNIIKVTANLTEAQKRAYTLNFSKEDTRNSPISLEKVSPDSYVITPQFLGILDNNYSPNLPEITFGSRGNTPKFLTIDKNVIDVNFTGRVFLSTPFYKILSEDYRQPYFWYEDNTKGLNSNDNKLNCRNNAEAKNLTLTENSQCTTSKMKINKTTVLTLSTTVKTNGNTGVSVCIYSEDLQACLNEQNKNVMVNGVEKVEITSPSLINSGDSIQVFLDITNLDNRDVITVAIEDLELNTYTNYSKPQLLYKNPTEEISIPVDLSNSSTLSYYIPIYQGFGAMNIDSSRKYAPEFSTFDYETKNKGKGEISTPLERFKPSYLLKNSNSSSTLYASIKNFDNYNRALIFINGKNEGGIPADIILRRKNSEIPIWEEKYYPKGETVSFDIIRLPRGITEYAFEINSKAYGLETTVNRVYNSLVINIPESWVETELTPITQEPRRFFAIEPLKNVPSNTFKLEGKLITPLPENAAVFYIPTNKSPYWKLVSIPKDKQVNSLLKLYANYLINSKNVKANNTNINGWMQAWEVLELPENENLFAIFWPNLIIYFGYTLTTVITLAISMAFVIQAYLNRKSKPTRDNAGTKISSLTTFPKGLENLTDS